MNAIGGFFELELNDNKTLFHDKAIAVNSGRNALKYVLLCNKYYKKIFVPYYMCEVILQPINKLKLNFEFYQLNSDLTPKLKNIKKNEVLLYVNYFGIINEKVKNIIKSYENVIIDNSQAFFSYPFNNTPTFYSPRKFFGLPDGGFAYTYKNTKINIERDNSLDRFSHLLERIENGPEFAYNLFRENDKKIDELPLRKMSIITEKLLRNINFNKVLQIRNNNFIFLHKHLKQLNELTPIIDEENIIGPMVYPFLKKGNNKIKEHIIKEKIYTATYWPNVLKWITKNSIEHYYAENIIPLPIDQRYNIADMQNIINILSKYV